MCIKCLLYNTLFLIPVSPILCSVPASVEFFTPRGVVPVPVTQVCYATEYGARHGARVDSSHSIQAAIDHCSLQLCEPGECVGVAVLPGEEQWGESVRYRSGPLYLHSNVVLVLLDGVILEAWGVEEFAWPSLYRRVEGVMTMGTASLINAGICQDVEYTPGVVGDQCREWGQVEYVGVVGSPGAVIDGAGDSGWWEVDKPARPTLINLGHASKAVLANITLVNSPFWTVHVPFSQYVDIHHINISSFGPNNDGIDPDSSNNIVIRDSIIDTGDDCIAVKSGKDEDGLMVNVPSYNVDVYNMTFLRGRGVAIGSETSGGVYNINFRNYSCVGTKRCVRIKSRKDRGSFVENIVYENAVMEDVETAISIDMFYGNDETATGPSPHFSNFRLENISGLAGSAGDVLCLPDQPCTHLQLANISIFASQGFHCSNVYGTVDNVFPEIYITEENVDL